uniref:MIT domain-containing protein 1 n=1 Tax=Ceratitis capitata TaxID=7213 RepID=W8BRH2_CERCA
MDKIKPTNSTRVSKYTGTRGKHAFDSEKKQKTYETETQQRREREFRDDHRSGRTDHHHKTERVSRRDREENSHHECKCERYSRSDVEYREGLDTNSACELRNECLVCSKGLRNEKEVKSERLSNDMKRAKDMKESKQNNNEKANTDNKILLKEIKELIMRALECELDGHLLEARMLYEESLTKLHICTATEKNEEFSESYRKYLGSYEKHVQRLRDQIEQNMFGCKIIEHIAIPEGTRGRSYEKLIGRYLNDKVTLVHIYEPYLTQSTHLEHLINFIEVLVKNCSNLMFVRIITRASPKLSKLQSEVLRDVREELQSGNISFNFQFDEELKKSRIVLSTGVVIRCRRGLHIYKPMSKYYKLGLYDYDFRRCESAEVDVYQGKPFSEAISKADRTELMESLLHT